MTSRHQGGCHCRAIRFEFGTDRGFAPRACQCSFCRKHGARSVSDPDGWVRLELGPEALRYRFASGSADYLVCGRCGIYVGAIADLDGEMFATLNLNAFDEPRLELEPVPVSYDGEDAATKKARRRARWTPARISQAETASHRSP